MKLIEWTFTDENFHEGVWAISLVDRPAIEQDFIALSKKQKPKQIYTKTVSKDQRLVAGPLMIPDLKIYRIDPNSGEEFEGYFSRDTVRQIAQNFFIRNNHHNHTIDHEKKVDGLTLVESWIVQDPVKDKSANFGYELPVGTWFGIVKAANSEVLERVENGELRGFSVEGFFDSNHIKNKHMKTNEDFKKSLIEKFKSIFGLEDQKFGSVKSGDMEIQFEGDVLEVGTTVMQEVEGEMVAVPDGSYELEDGSSIVVAAGAVTEVVPSEGDEPEMMSKADFLEALSEALEGFAEVIKEDQKKTKEEFATEIAKVYEEFGKSAQNPTEKKEKSNQPQEEKTLKEMIAEKKAASKTA